MLIGRHDEQRAIDDLLAAARRGESGALVVRGDAGMGKTTLLDQAAATGEGMQVLRTRGFESESELAFSGLIEALRPVLDDLPRLPERQAAALRGALALEASDTDVYAVYAGTLGLLSLTAERAPLLLLIDDAHWLDSGSAAALAFACRRLGNEGIAALWATRTTEPTSVVLDGLPSITLAGLTDDEALRLVVSADRDLSPETTRALVELTGGNPLALVELPGVLTPPQRDGRQPIEEPLPTSPTLLAAFGRRLGGLPEESRRLLLIAAAIDTADLTTILRAGALEGLHESHLEVAERAGLVVVEDGLLGLRHPLVRAAIYGSADPVARRAAHRAIAASLADEQSIDRRVWHRALAAAAPDEAVAAELEGVGSRAEGRSWQAAARAYEQAARLTPARGERARRLVAAAQAWSECGRNDAAEPLLRDAVRLGKAPALLTDAEHLLGCIAFLGGRTQESLELLTRAAERVPADDPARAARVLADTVEPWLSAGDTSRAEATAQRAWELSKGEGGSSEIWAALRYGDVLGWQGEVERAAELWLRAAAVSHPGDLRSLCAIGEALFSSGDDERASTVLEHVVTECRATGSPGLLPYALHSLGLVEARRGRLTAAIEADAEAAELARALGQPRERLMAVRGLAWTAALLGREDDCLQHLEAAAAAWVSLGRDQNPDATKGMLALSVGRTDDAIRELEPLVAEPWAPADAIAARSFAPNLLEAYVRAGRDAEAEKMLERFEALADRSGRAASRALALRCRAALEGSVEHFEAALALHDEWRNSFEQARTQLLYGELLRRQKRRAAARVRLRAALAVFDEMGAVGWADLTRTALNATGERARRRDPSTVDDLTPQETTVARLVASGLTNREVAARLFLSPKTIETHLTHVFRKTGVRSRTELANKLRDSPDSSVALGS